MRKYDDEWDVITATVDGWIIWRRYGDRKIVIAPRGESPDDALERQSAGKKISEPKQEEQKNMSRTDPLLQRTATLWENC